ncbi:MAG: ABC transporter ATP-binding protein [Chloroflexi bacterium]|nr:ABC transporter ATP-binding protein [Chloroflexota bacterium]MCH8816323.1 ABC transporter ATP-binding protein [Chloroflexota bacterium]
MAKLTATTSPGLLIFGTLTILGTAIFFVLIPVLLGTAIDTAFELSRATDPDSGAARSALLDAAYVIILVSVLRGAFAYGQMYAGEVLGQTLATTLRNQYYEKLQRLSFSFHDNAHTGNLMSRGITDIDGVRMFAHTGMLRVLYLVLLIAGSAYLMLSLDWMIGLLTLAFVPLVAFRGTIMRLRSRAVWIRIQEEMGMVNTALQENLGGVRVVRSFSGQDHEERKFANSSERVKGLMDRAAEIRASEGSLMTFSLLVAYAVLIWFGGTKVIDGDMTIGELTQFLTFLGMLQMPIRMLPMLINSWARASSAGSRLFEILDLELPIQNSPNARPLKITEGVLRYEDVSFSYGDVPVIKNISFEARPGHTIGIVGPPGSGKTTIAQLAPRHYNVDSGRITIDGQDIREVTLESLRQRVRLVQQDTFLFRDTVSDNIAYGEPDADEGRIIDSAEDARLHQHITGMPQGYDSMVGERGVSLSGGQRQRMAIARAIVLQPKIFIFDDSTSAIDAATERLIRHQIAKRAADATTIIIAHRLSTLLSADEILVIDEGRIIERGSHKELLKLNGRYREMHDLQVRPSDDLSGAWLGFGGTPEPAGGDD